MRRSVKRRQNNQSVTRRSVRSTALLINHEYSLVAPTNWRGVRQSTWLRRVRSRD